MVTSSNNFKDRSVTRNHKADTALVNLTVLANCIVEDVEMKEGQVLQVTKAEAKRLIALNKTLFKISLD